MSRKPSSYQIGRQDDDREPVAESACRARNIQEGDVRWPSYLIGPTLSATLFRSSLCLLDGSSRRTGPVCSDANAISQIWSKARDIRPARSRSRTVR